MFPVFSEAFTGSQITVGPPFFNQIIIPISLILLFLSGIGPLLAWRKTSKESLVRNFSIPSILGLVVVLIGILMGLIGLYPIITTFLCAFVFFTIVIEFWRGIKVRNNKYNENIIIALLNMINKNRSRYGGYIVHLGIVIMFIGFIGKAFDIEKESSLRIGESISLSNYKITLLNLRESERPNHYAWIADLEVEKDGKIISTLVPEKRVYFHKNENPDRRQPHSELSIFSTWREDIYSIFGGIDTEKDLLSIKIMINRLVKLVWLGGYFVLFGTVIALWPKKSLKRI